MSIERDRRNATRVDPLPPEELVPMLRFVVGVCRATAALLRFCVEVARERSADPMTREPRVLHTS